MKPEDSIISSARIEQLSVRKAFLIDGHPLYLDGYCSLLKALGPPPQELNLIDKANKLDPKSLPNHSRDIAILDIYSIGNRGLELLIDMRINAPDLKIIIATAPQESFLIDWCLALGVAGYIPKSTPKQVMLRALRKITRGERWTPDLEHQSEQDQALQTPKAGASMHLTQKEITTLKYLVLGMVNRDIAEKMHVTESTTKSHVSAIIRKLGVINRTQVFTEYQRINNPSNQFTRSLRKIQIRHSEVA
ncbi:MAG: DNA-binding response regulator [Rhodomicrobium sp.]|nr:MAG: DNA-binding response regulator [Rhodomicrobium sp.]